MYISHDVILLGFFALARHWSTNFSKNWGCTASEMQSHDPFIFPGAEEPASLRKYIKNLIFPGRDRIFTLRSRYLRFNHVWLHRLLIGCCQQLRPVCFPW